MKIENKGRCCCPREQSFIGNVLLKITGFKVKFEHLYKQTGTLQIVIRVLIKDGGIVEETIVRKGHPQIGKKRSIELKRK